MRISVGLTVKTCSYLIDDSSEDRKGRKQKKACDKKKVLKLKKLIRRNST